MILSIIVARSKNNVIGINNQLPWHLTDDLKNFKKITSGHPVIMGRKTYESIGRPLPNRTNIIITRQKDFLAEGCVTSNSLEEAIGLAEKTGTDESFIIGGADLINQSLKITDKIYLTEVDAVVEGDTFLGTLRLEEWEVIDQKNFLKSEKGNDYDFAIVEYVRRK